MSFGREIKDFIAAAQSGQKMVSSLDDRQYKKLRTQYLQTQIDKASDPELIKLNKDVLRARANRLNRGPRPIDPLLQRSRKLDIDYKEKRNKILDEPPAPAAVPAGPADGVGDYGTPPSAAPALPGPQGALDLDNQPDPYTTAGGYDGGDDSDNSGDGYDQPEQFAARGGLIRRLAPTRKPVKYYATGGAVEDEGDDDSVGDDNLPVGDASSENASAVGDDTEADDLDRADAIDEARDNDSDSGADADTTSAPPLGYSAQAAHDAVRGGLQYAANATGAASDASPGAGSAIPNSAAANAIRRRAGLRSYLTGAGAASPSEMDAVREAVDPKHQMSESERNMAALARVYEWKLTQGDVTGANRAAGSMIQYYRQVSDRYKALAQVAASKGSVDGTLQAAAKAYANVPDGRDLKFAKQPDGSIAYSFTDTQSGKTVEKGVATPDQILTWASRGGIQSFDDLVSRAAGTRAAGKGGSNSKPQTPRDEKAMNDVIDNEFADADPTKDPTVVPLKSAAAHIALAPVNRQNNVQIREAVGAAKALIDPAQKPAALKKVDGGAMVSFGGQPIFVPAAQMDQFAAIRAKRVDAAKKAAAAANRPGVISRAVGAVGDAIDAGKAAAAQGTEPPSVLPAAPYRPTVGLPAGPALTPQRVAPVNPNAVPPRRHNYITGEDLRAVP